MDIANPIWPFMHWATAAGPGAICSACMKPVCVLLAVLTFSGPVLAQTDGTRAAARKLGTEGVAAFQAGNYQHAVDKLERSFKVLRVPSLGLWSARALAKNGKLLEASERYREVARLDAAQGDAQVQKQSQLDAAKELEEILARIPNLQVEVSGVPHEDVRLTIDGQPVPSALIAVAQPSNPGLHVVEAQYGQQTLRREVVLKEGSVTTKVTLPFSAGVPPAAKASGAAAQEAAQEPQVTPAANGSAVSAGTWVGIATAGVGVLVGGGAAFLASRKKADIASSCTGNVCDPGQRSAVESYNRLLTISTVGFVAAGLGLAGAGIFLLTSPRAPRSGVHAAAWVGPQSAGVSGEF